MTEIEELRKKRKELERVLKDTEDIEKEKRQIRELQQMQKRGSSFGQKIKKLHNKFKSFEFEAEKTVHPERFKQDGTRKKGKAGQQ